MPPPQLSSLLVELLGLPQETEWLELLSLLDSAGCFDLLGIPLPTDQRGSVSRLAEENLVVRTPGGRFDISNLGAILFAKNLNQFER